jgi:hypothetical protein
VLGHVRYEGLGSTVPRGLFPVWKKLVAMAFGGSHPTLVYFRAPVEESTKSCRGSLLTYI